MMPNLDSLGAHQELEREAEAEELVSLRKRVEELEDKLKGDRMEVALREDGLTAERDSLQARVKELEELCPQRLAKAWAKYTAFYGEPPHGTVRQLAAMLVLMPKEG
jgi:hypothetical protein